jgi:ubiquitin-conjugating enzyme E2 Z
MNNSSIRIVTDIIDFNNNRPDDIYIYFDKKDVKKIYAMIIGPTETPYYGGFFFFEIVFPDNYPTTSPSVKFLTTDGNVRFNPNLYANGKVCLSILGTWSGPKWEPVMTLKSVLLSIQSLMNQMPLRNEPGFENVKDTDTVCLQYTQYVQYNTYRVAILNVLENKLKYSFNLFEIFNNEIIYNFKKNYNNLKNDILSYSEILGSIPIVHCGYSVQLKTLNFTELCNEFIEKTKIYI